MPSLEQDEGAGRQRGGDGGGARWMNGHPLMPLPAGELMPQAVCDAIRDWASAQGFSFQQLPHASEFAKVNVRAADGTNTFTTVHNPHRGRRLRRDQVRSVVRNLNINWKG